jgi:hypothetical protein
MGIVRLFILGFSFAEKRHDAVAIGKRVGDAQEGQQK